MVTLGAIMKTLFLTQKLLLLLFGEFWEKFGLLWIPTSGHTGGECESDNVFDIEIEKEFEKVCKRERGPRSESEIFEKNWKTSLSMEGTSNARTFMSDFLQFLPFLKTAGFELWSSEYKADHLTTTRRHPKFPKILVKPLRPFDWQIKDSWLRNITVQIF